MSRPWVGHKFLAASQGSGVTRPEHSAASQEYHPDPFSVHFFQHHFSSGHGWCLTFPIVAVAVSVVLCVDFSYRTVFEERARSALYSCIVCSLSFQSCQDTFTDYIQKDR